MSDRIVSLAGSVGTAALAADQIAYGEGMCDSPIIIIDDSETIRTTLKVFLERPQRVLSRDQLLDLARGREAVAFDRAIDTLVSRLRRKLERDPKNPELIKTIWGGGYLFAADVTQV